jgi:DNA-binding MarR family transcriptional regulator
MRTDNPPLPFGTALALAQRYLTRQLNQTIDARGLPAVEWFTLNALGLRGPTLPTATLADLSATNGLDRPAVDALLADMAERGLVETTAAATTLTGAGRARFEEVRDALATNARQTFSRLDADRVEAARALLQEIAELDGDPIGSGAV